MSETLEAPATRNAEVKGGVVAYLNVDGAVEAAKFYEKAFGAQIEQIHPPDEQGRTMHVHLYINGSSVMLGDFYPEHGFEKVAPQAFAMMIMTDNIEAAFKRAADAGAEVVMPPQKMFWGDYYGQLKDRWGVLWAMNQPD